MKTFKILFLNLGFVILNDSAMAQEENIPNTIPLPSLEDKMMSEPSERRDGQYFSINVENDSFGGGRDENYTSGVRFSYHNARLSIPDWAKSIGELYPGFRINDTTAITYSFGQNLYTPKNITLSPPAPNDRPYAGWLYASAALSTVTDNHQDQFEIALGVVGPASLGKITQNFVHNHIFTDSDDPQGWNSQLKNEPGLMLSWGREYPDLWSTYWDERIAFSLAPSFGATVGNIYTLAQVGLGFRVSPYEDRFADLPTRVRPSIPGNGYFQKPEDKWSWGFFGGVTGYAVGRNIFLDGNTWQDSPSVDKKPLVYDAFIGIDTTYSNTRLSYTLNKRSKEFDGQDNASVFGSIALTRRF